VVSCAKNDEVGASFGVLKIHGRDIDITMPRTERATGVGHKDFDVTVDPYMDTRDAARRRDFTVNALMKNVLIGKVIDYFSGLDDLRARRISHIDDRTFVEDPLRVFRAAGFASRLSASICERTRELCMQINVPSLHQERVFEETNKALLKAERPSVYFQELAAMRHLEEFFPEVAALRGVQQDPEYHPEGNAFVHTMMVVDNAATVRNDVEDALGLMYSTLYHDIG